MARELATYMHMTALQSNSTDILKYKQRIKDVAQMLQYADNGRVWSMVAGNKTS
mgnify:CR=1 FL=1